MRIIMFRIVFLIIKQKLWQKGIIFITVTLMDLDGWDDQLALLDEW